MQKAHKLQVAVGKEAAGRCLAPAVAEMRVLSSPHSLGVVLSQGHGEYILLGNTSVEDGGSVPSTAGQRRRKCRFSKDTEQGQPGVEPEPPRSRICEQTLRAGLPGEEGSVWSAGLPVSCQSLQSRGRAIVESFAGLAGWASPGMCFSEQS